MKVLLPASEVAPLIKFGGLGDVIGSLPKALEKLHVDVDVAIPFYPTVDVTEFKVYKSLDLNVPFGEENNQVEVYKTKLPNSRVDVLLFKNAEYFAKGGTSAFARTRSETEMFSFFDRCVVEYIKSRYNNYDLVHCNDWHTGLITHLLADELGTDRPATLFTIHNLMYQGVGDMELVRDLGFSPGAHPLIDWDVQDGDLNMLQQGITSSDYVNAVSERYAEEILTPEFGGEMYEILQARAGRISGILNGINYDDFPRDFGETTWISEKAAFKKALLSELHLSEDGSDKPLFSFIGRLDAFQKGLDILVEAIPEIVKGGGQFILLGTGDKKWEDILAALSEDPALKDHVSTNILFDVDLAVKIYTASDFLLIPSRYEPCGLIQMIAMHYGTLPIAHAVGGLRDSVEDGHNGILFDKYSSQSLTEAITRAFSVYFGQDRIEMVKNALEMDFSWDASAKKYKELYEKVISLKDV